MNTQAVNAKTAKKSQPGLFTFNYVTVWGVYVPVEYQPGLLVYLIDSGYDVKARGHTIMVSWSDSIDTVSEVRTLIEQYAAGTWNAKGAS